MLQEEETTSDEGAKHEFTAVSTRVSVPRTHSAVVHSVTSKKSPERSVARIDGRKQEHAKMEDTDSFTVDIAGGTEEVQRKRRQEYHVRQTDAGFESAFVDEVRVKKTRNTSTVETSGDFPLPVSLSDAIQYGLLNSKTGMFTDPQTGNTLTLDEALKNGFIVPSSATFRDPASNRSCNLEEAIDRNLLEPTGQYHVSASERMNLETLIRKAIIVTSKVPMLPGSGRFMMDMHRVTVESAIDPRTGEEINTAEATKRGLLDLDRGVYVNLKTGETMSIQEAVDMGFLKEQGTKPHRQTKSYTVTGAIDPDTNTMVSVGCAIEKGVIDQANGQYIGVDERGQPQPISISEAIKQGLVLAEPSSVSTTDVKTSGPKYIQVTKTFTILGVIDPVSKDEIPVSEGISRGIIDQSKGHYMNPSTGEKMLLVEAIGQGLIIAEIASSTSPSDASTGNVIMTSKRTTYTLTGIVDPANGQEISVAEALQKGILNQEKGEYHNLSTGEIVSLGDAIDQGLVLIEHGSQAAEEKPQQFERAESICIDDSQDEEEEVTVEDVTEETKTFQITGVKDPVSGEIVPYQEALQVGMIDEQNGVYVNASTGDTMPINEALNQGLIIGELISKTQEHNIFHSVMEVGQKEPAQVPLASVLNPITGLEIGVMQAVKLGLLTDDRKSYYHPVENRKIPIDEAIKRGFVNPSSYDVAQMRPHVALKDSGESSEMHVTRKTKPRAVINWTNGSIRDSATGEEITREAALARGLIDVKTAALLSRKVETLPFYGMTGDRQSHEIVIMEETRTGEMSGRTETRVIQMNGHELTEGRERDDKKDDEVVMTIQTTQLVQQIPDQVVVDDDAAMSEMSEDVGGVLSFEKAVKLGLYSLKSHKFRDPSTGESMTLQDAIDEGFIDLNSVALVNIVNGATLTLREAFRERLIDKATGKIDESKAQRDGFVLDPQFTRHETETPPPMNLLDAIMVQLLDPETGRFTHPVAGGEMSLQEAVSRNLVCGPAMVIMDPNSGRNATLESGLRSKIINGDSGAFVDTNSGKKLFSLKDAVRSNLIESAYREEKTEVRDHNSGDVVSLEWAIKTRIIDNDSPMVYDPKTRCRISVKEAIKKGLMNAQNMTYSLKSTGQTIPVAEAARLGLIVPVGAPVLAKGSGISHLMQTLRERREIDEKVTRIEEQITERFVPKDRAISQDVPMLPIDNGSVVEIRRQPEQMMSMDAATHITPVSVTMDKSGVKVAQTTKMVVEKNKFSETVTETRLPEEPKPTPSYKSPATTEYHPVIREVVTRDSTVKGLKTDHRPIRVADVEITEHQGYDIAQVDHQAIRLADVTEQPAFATARVTTTKTDQTDVVKHDLVNIDWQTGEIIDTVTKQTITASEALERGLIDMHIAQLIEKRKKLVSEVIPSRMTLNEAASRGLLIIPLGRITNPVTKQRMTIEEAIDIKFLDAEHSVIINPATEQPMTVTEAIEGGIMDPHSGDVKNTSSGKTLTLTEMSLEGFIPEHGIRRRSIKAMPLKEAIERGLVDVKTGTYTDVSSGQVMEVSRAVHLGYLEVTQTVTSETISETTPVVHGTVRETIQQRPAPIALDRAIQLGLVDMDSGTFREPNTGEVMSLAASIVDGYIIAPEEKQGPSMVAPEDQLTFEEAMRRGLIDIKGNTFMEPITEVLLPLDAAIRQGYLLLPEGGVTVTITEHVQSQTLERKKKKKTVTFVDAVEEQLIDIETAEYIDPETAQRRPLRDAIQDKLINPHGVPSVPGTGITVTEAVERGLFDTNTGMFTDHGTGKRVSLMEAVSEDYINGETIYYDTSDAHVFTLNQGLKDGRIDMHTGHFVDARTSRRMPIAEAATMGLLAVVGSPILSGIAINEALRRGAENRTSSRPRTVSETIDTTQIRAVFEPQTQRFISVDEARQRGILDEENCEYLDVVSGQRMRLDDALTAGLVSTTWQEEVTTSSEITVSRSLLERSPTERVTIVGVVDAKTGQKMSVQEAVDAGLFNKQAGQYVHPLSGEIISLVRAIDAGFVLTAEPRGEEVLSETIRYNILSVMDTRTGQYITPVEATQLGILNMKAEVFIDVSSDQRMTLTEALKRGLVQAEPLSAVAEDESDDQTTVTTMMTKLERQTFSIKSVVDPVTKEMLHPREAIRRNILDLPHGLYVNTQTGETMQIHEAFAAGYIIAEEVEEVSSAVPVVMAKPQTVTYAIRGVWDPRTKEEVGTREAISEGLLDQEMSKYINVKTGQTYSIKEAIEQGFVFLEDSAPPSIAVFQNTKSYTIKSVIDPRSGEEIPISDAVRHQIVDKVKAQYWNMKTDERISIDEAIFRGLVNVERVEDSAKRDALVEAAAKVYSLKLVTDPCTNQKYNPTEAERRGLINKIQGVYMDPVSGKKMSIREAIAQGFIEAEELEEPDYDDLPEDVTTYATLQTVGGSEVTHISLVIDVATGEEISVMEAVRRGIIDPVAGVYTVPNTGETLVLSQALERGFVRTNHDPGHTVQMTRTVNVKGVVDPQSGRRMSPSEAARVGILDMQQQRLLVDRTTGQTISLKEAENRGLLVFESGTAPMLVPSKGVEFTVETETTYVTSADTLDRTSRERSPQKPRDTTNGVAVPEPEGPVKFTEALKMGLVDSENSLFFCSSTKTQMPVAEAVRSGILIADIPIQFETKQRDTSTRSRETSVSSTTPRPVTQPMDDSRDIITREHVERTRMSPAGDAGASGRVVVTKTTTVDRVTLKPDGTIIRNERSERRMDEEETYDESHVTATHRSVTSSEPPAVVVQNGSSVTTEDTRLGAYMTQPGFVITTEGHVLNVTTGARMSIEQALVSGLIEMPRDQVDCTAHDRTISDMSALASSTEDVVSTNILTGRLSTAALSGDILTL